MNDTLSPENGEPKQEEEDDFFGDQSGDTFMESDRQNREIEVLRREHLTTGIREGVSAAHEAHLQQGFDEGFEDGAKAAAEPGFLLGACSLLEAFLAKGKINARRQTSRILGDTEVPIKDIEDVKHAAAKLRQDLSNLPQNGSVSVQEAVAACQKVAMVTVPAALAGATPGGTSNTTQP